MCTVKKDLNIPEATAVIEHPPSLPPKAPAEHYDLINRQQSQLLLDMIYATKKPCFFSTKLPCPGTPAAAAVAEKGLAEELATIKAELAELKAQVAGLPGAIVAALKQEQERLAAQEQANLVLVEVESEMTEEEEEEEDEDEDLEDFDRLSSSSSSAATPQASKSPAAAAVICENSMSTTTCHSSASRTTSMSSDIEVLSSFHHCFSSSSSSSGTRPPVCPLGAASSNSFCSSAASVLNSTSNPMNRNFSHSISKELQQLSAKLKTLEVLPKQHQPTSSTTNGQAIASSLFSHWADRFATASKQTSSSSGAPTGNIGVSKSGEKPSPVKILPYSSAIDVNHWLK